MKKAIALLITLITIIGPTTTALARSHHNRYDRPRYSYSRHYHHRHHRHHSHHSHHSHHHHGHGGAIVGGILAGVILGTVIANSTKDKSPTPTENCNKD